MLKTDEWPFRVHILRGGACITFFQVVIEIEIHINANICVAAVAICRENLGGTIVRHIRARCVTVGRSNIIMKVHSNQINRVVRLLEEAAL
jgi:hypothetical protein